MAQLVERQVVALEVEGSSPSSYPIRTKNITTLINILNIVILANTRVNKYYILKNYMLTSKRYKLNTYRPNKLNSVTSNSFKIFINCSMYNNKRIFKVHHTYNIDGLISSSNNAGFNNIKSFLNSYKKFFNLIYYITYFKLPTIMFSNNIFREEVCSINWAHLSNHLFIWKYNYYSIFFKPSKLKDSLVYTFTLFKQARISSSIVTDTQYHNKTIYYLHRYNFYSIGISDAGKSKYILNSSLPALGESITSQLFFIRMLTLINKIVVTR